MSVRSAVRPSIAHVPAIGLAITVAIALTLTFAAATAPTASAQPGDARRWIATWTASPQPLWDGDFPLATNVPFQVWNQTVRQVARVSLGGTRVRVLLSNEYGARPLTIGAAHLARSESRSRIAAGSDRPLTFGGRRTVTIPPGAPMLSDPVELTIAPLGSVAVSLYLPEPTPPSTFHWDGLQTAFIAAGNLAHSQELKSDATINARVFLRAILVEAPADARAVVAFGDSITDGAASTPDTNRRWPDLLAQRLASRQVAVLNAGISGARILSDRMGMNALARFDRDVLSEPHVAAAIVMIGINDIGWPGSTLAPRDPAITAEEMIAGYRQLIARARLRGVRIIGATLTPFEGALTGSAIARYYSADKERVRQAVNTWIRDSREFDAVIDFDAILRDPAQPTRVRAPYDSGDHLHPGDAGYQAMAEAIDLATLFAKP